MIAAIYARKSTEQQGADADAKSVARQIESARAFADQQGWTVADADIYADDAVSGAETSKLVNRRRLLDAIAGGPPYQVLIMRDASRFSRRDGDEAFSELKAIARAGVDVWFYQDGTRFEYGNFTANITGIVRAEMNAEYRRQISRWTRDAMERKARAGHVTGGRVFGYDNVRVEGHVERRINVKQATAVRRIFEMAVAGAGVKKIAKTLNAERVPSPRAQQGRPNGWAPSSVRPVLHRTLYKGVITWGKTKQRDASGERKYRRLPPSDRLEIPAPELRIVSDELWEAAHRRLKASAATYLRGTRGQLWGRPPTGLKSRYLLTGLSRCGACGSGLMAHSRSQGRQRWRYYVCTGFHNRGRTVCANSIPLPMAQADEAVIGQLRDYVLQPEIVEGAVQDALDALRPKAGDLKSRRTELQAEIRNIDEEAARLTAAIASGGELQSLVKALKDRDKQRVHGQRELDMLERLTNVSDLDVGRIERDLRARVKDWRSLLRRQTPISRQILTKLLADRLVFMPRAEQGRYEFSGEAQLGRLMQGVVLPQVWRPQRDSTLSCTTSRSQRPEVCSSLSACFSPSLSFVPFCVAQRDTVFLAAAAVGSLVQSRPSRGDVRCSATGANCESCGARCQH